MRKLPLLFLLLLTGSLSAQDDLRLFKPASMSADSSARVEVTPYPQASPKRDTAIPGNVQVMESDRIKVLMTNYAAKKQPLKGYRIQIYLGDRSTAENTRRTFLLQHPDTPAYLSYLAPNFRVRVGDLRDRVAAEYLRESLKNEFPGLYVVPDEIEPPRLTTLKDAEGMGPADKVR